MNNKIKKLNDNGFNYNFFKKIEQTQIVDNSVEFNKKFLKRNLKQIFSVNISNKYKNYDKDNNKKLIQKLLRDKNEERKEYFKKLFKLTFLDCLQHFRGSQNIPLLDSMTTITYYKKNMKMKKNI